MRPAVFAALAFDQADYPRRMGGPRSVHAGCIAYFRLITKRVSRFRS